MECEKIREKFSSLLEGDLSPFEEKMIKEHLSSCLECQRDFETFKKTMNWLHSVDQVETPDGFLTEIYQKMEDRKRMESRRGWVHWLSRMNLPAQAIAMVAIVFAVLYITKMIPMETPREKDVDAARTPRSEVKTDTHLAQKEVKKEKQEIALLSEAPRTKEMEQEKTPLSEGKEIEKVAFPPTSEPGKIGNGMTLEGKPSVAAKPSQEIILRVSDQEKALFQLQGLVNEFGGEIVREEKHGLLASLPAASYPQFAKKLEGMTSPKKAEPASPQQVAPRASKMDSRAMEDKSAGKGKEKEMGRPMADQEGRITVRILLVKE
jgi:hypothetical protein